MFTKCLKSYYFNIPRRLFCQSQSSNESLDPKTKILKTALVHVNKSGWNDQTLAETCVDLGYPAVTSRILSNGPVDLVYYIMDRWNERLVEDLTYLDLEEMRISDRILEGIKIRLSYQIPYLTRWHEAMALGGLPSNLPTTMEKLTNVADEIWFIAGDRSVDLNWYTKRGLLISAYVSTELFMLTDKSENYVETWKFLDRRIKDILEYGKYINIVRNFTSGINVGLNSFVSLLAVYPNKFENDIEELKAQTLNRKIEENITLTENIQAQQDFQEKPKHEDLIPNKNKL